MTHLQHARALIAEGELPVLSGAQIIERTGAGRAVDNLRTKLGFPGEMLEAGVWPVVHAYAEFVQLLPAPASRHRLQPGGLFLYGVDAVAAALDYRRGQILPKGAPPEVIGEKHHRWTYAVLLASLLHEVDRPLAVLRVSMRRAGQSPVPWLPLMGTLAACGAASYRWDIIAQDEGDELRGVLPLLLFDRFVPDTMMAWLASDTVLTRALLRHLSADKVVQGEALHELALRAHAQASGVVPKPVASERSDESRATPAGHAARRAAKPADEEFLEPVDEPETAKPGRKA